MRSAFRKNVRVFLFLHFVFLFQAKIFSQSSTFLIFQNQQNKESAKKLINAPKDHYGSTDLCEASRNGVNAANLLSRDSTFSSAIISLRNTGRDKNEHSVTFGKDANLSIAKSPIIKGDSSNGKIDSNWPGAFTDIHNHTNDLPPSAGDLYYLIKLNRKNLAYNTRFVVTLSGAVYALYVYDLKLAGDFAAKYPVEQSRGFSPRFPEPIFDDVDRISIYFEGEGVNRLIAQERAMAFILTKFHTGTVLLKQGSDGKFIALQTEEIISNNLASYVAIDCN